MYKISDKIINLITKVEMTAGVIHPNKGENPKRHFPKRLTFATVICYSNDVTQ